MDGDLRKIFREHLPMVHWQSIETGMTGRGIPDTNGCYQGTEFWVEFKQTRHWTVGLRPEQVAWISRRARAGGRVWVAVRRRPTPSSRRQRVLVGRKDIGVPGRGAPVADELWLLYGSAAKSLVDGGLRHAGPSSVAGTYYGGPGQWPWQTILGLLTQIGRRG